MDLVKKYFPTSLRADNLKGLLVAILIYAIVNLVGGFVLGLLSKLPLIGFVASFAGWLLGAYCAIGVIAAILLFFGIIK